MKKVGNTSFQEDTIKKMTLKEFKETYKGVLKGQDLKEVYQEITGSHERNESESKSKIDPTEDYGNLG